MDAWPIYIVPSAALPSVCATEPIYIWQRNECTVERVRACYKVDIPLTV